MSNGKCQCITSSWDVDSKDRTYKTIPSACCVGGCGEPDETDLLSLSNIEQIGEGLLYSSPITPILSAIGKTDSAKTPVTLACRNNSDCQGQNQQTAERDYYTTNGAARLGEMAA